MTRDEKRFRGFEERLWSSVGVRPTERRLRLDGLGVSVRVQEVGEGPTVLFIHGTSSAGASWASLVANLDGFRCVLLDRPGCGLSEALPGKAGEADLGAVNAVADRLVERLLEFSWPMGAPMARIPLAMRFAGIPGIDTMTAKMPVGRTVARLVLRQIGLAAAIDSGRFTDEMLDWYVSLLRDTDSMQNEMRASPKVITPIAGLNQAILLSDELLQRITMPVCFFWGEDDPNGGAAVAEQFAARFPDATLELRPGAGHAPWIDQPGRAAAVTSAFFSAAA